MDAPNTEGERILDMLWRLQMPWITGLWGSQPYFRGNSRKSSESVSGVFRNFSWPKEKLALTVGAFLLTVGSFFAYILLRSGTKKQPKVKVFEPDIARTCRGHSCGRPRSPKLGRPSKPWKTSIWARTSMTRTRGRLWLPGGAPSYSLCAVFCWENDASIKNSGSETSLPDPLPDSLCNSLCGFSLCAFSVP